MLVNRRQSSSENDRPRAGDRSYILRSKVPKSNIKKVLFASTPCSESFLTRFSSLITDITRQTSTLEFKGEMRSFVRTEKYRNNLGLYLFYRETESFFYPLAHVYLRSRSPIFVIPLICSILSVRFLEIRERISLRFTER